MTLALYRKYRPKQFEDFLGQEEVRKVLQEAGRQDRMAHAYLFYGPRGTGKTTAARLIAKLANCEKRITDLQFRTSGEPCNACAPCVAIDAGNAFDVLEIDAASNRGIDEIRDLKESIKLSPSVYRYKIFIIDEVHMLTREAFNALLKTLEEPPAHAIFILATTEYDKIPPTIASRTQRFHFRKLTLTQIIQKLETIVAEESFTVTREALELIASIAEGSLRDAESLLAQVVAFGEMIDINTVERIVGRVGYRGITEFAELLLTKNLHGTLTRLNELITSGHNITDFNKELITYLRRLLALAFDPTLSKLFSDELTKEELVLLSAQATTADKTFVINLLQSLIRSYTEMRYSPIALAPFEVAIIRGFGAPDSSDSPPQQLR